MFHEEWRPVAGFEGLYEVSDHGRVRSVRAGNHVNKRLQGKVLKERTNKVGYPVVSLYRGGKATRKERTVHRLVLEAFVGPAPDGCEVLHGDGTKINNHLSNLRWGTRSENMRDYHALCTAVAG